MNYTPFDKFIIETKKGESELTTRLSEQIEPKKYFRTNQYSTNQVLKPYEGIIENNSFRINRIIKYQNPFLPRITGEFKTQYGGGSKILIKMRIKYSIMIFAIIWSFAPTLFFLSFSSNSTEDKNIIPQILISFIWISIGYLSTYFPFNYERKKSKKFLIDLFKNS